ncbi:g protein alpha i subunit [Anaeramoeba flamelloides]|uniref:G protein alpha i subunit n=1 Tax=Anaeramoeba flamelloides TaxID=1746091 RepID=A0AAV7Z8F2_9EUKA|nr:g protein alpha i subunit [Anaeramoeba flamelloides]
MGPSQSRKERRAKKKRNKRLEKEFAQDNEELNKEIKILVLGTGDSGKSTFVKQMQILYKEGFNESEKELYRNAIRENIKNHVKELLRIANRLGLTLQKPTL